jgi:hypothetical protein
MIKIKNTADFLVQADQVGTVTAAVKKTFYAPFAGVVIACGQAIRVAGTTGSQIADVLINTASIFATAGNKPTLTTGLDSGTVEGKAKIDGTRTFAKGALITLSIPTVHSGTPATDVVIWAVLRQLPAAGVAAFEE